MSPDGETVLIDPGDWRQSGQEVLEYLDAHEIDRIGHLVGTHAPADHIGGHDAIEVRFEDGTLVGMAVLKEQTTTSSTEPI